MRSPRVAYGILLVAVIAGCSSPQVGYDYDRGANFDRYRTYAWMSGGQQQTGDKRLDSSLVDARVRTAIDGQLRSKGYIRSVKDVPDFLVTYHIGLKDVLKGASTQNYIGDRAHGTFTTINDIQPYQEGALTIDIVDASSQQLVWQASVKAEIDDKLGPKERDERVNAVVRAMLSKFPPR